MQEDLKKIEDAINEAISKTEDKELVERLGSIKVHVNEADTAYKKLEQEQKDLLKDYKEVIIHSNYEPSKDTSKDPASTNNEPPRLEDFIIAERAKRK